MSINSQTSRRMSNAVRIAILSPSVLIFISATRLLIIANYDPTIASSIASSSGVVNTLIGTLVPIVPALLPLLVLALIVLRKLLLLVFAAIGASLVSPTYSTVKEAWRATVSQFTAVGHIFNIKSARPRDHALSISWLHDRAGVIFGIIVILVIVIDKHKALRRPYGQDKSGHAYFIDRVY